MTKITALMKFLSLAAKRLGVGEHVYVVGGAVRNHLLGLAPKDIDVVVDSVALGGKKDSEWFARQLARLIPAQTNLTTNQYGVAILTVSGPWTIDGHDLKGEVIEIANARKESYGGPEGKGYKPHMVEPATIEEDLLRRDFTVNTLLWRLEDLEQGPQKAKVLDLLGKGVSDLQDKRLVTPVDPDITFSDDPTRMIRAVRFCVKHGFELPEDISASIRKNAHKLTNAPWNAIFVLVGDLLEL
jgi:poly(A) polymerase